MFSQVNSIVGETPVAFYTNILFSGKALQSHIVHTLDVKSVEQCFSHCLECLQRSDGCFCASFNYRKSGTGNGRLCEINKENHETVPGDFKVMEGSQYYVVY
ncbi:uncharacterized protein LOC135683846 [Rhopilema esculentum]|uniref:uncharacterized protein LOC135683846 n=1 Tax=Rhopilema esculentum TaxID=499914 RepID=UPI0031D14F23